MISTVAAIALSVLSAVEEAPQTKSHHTTVYRNSQRWGQNTCAHAFDGDCDDGGPGSEYSYCRPNTDASDCGGDACNHNFDGDCDDGGPGADWSLCALGTDRSDCLGRRGTSSRSFSSSSYGGGGSYGGNSFSSSPRFSFSSSFSSRPTSFSSSSMCTNTCAHDHDGDCDDGGPGAEWSFCAIGTDCADCGAHGFAFLRAEADAIDQRVFPALRDQKIAKSAGQNRRASLSVAFAAVAIGAVALVAAVLVKGRVSRAPTGAATSTESPAML